MNHAGISLINDISSASENILDTSNWVIYYNVMLYGWYIIDTNKVNDIRGSNDNATTITPDQLNHISKSIDDCQVKTD